MQTHGTLTVTTAVTSLDTLGRVETQRLDAGDELHCPHCHRWHPLIKKHSSGTDATIRMLYFECCGLPYFGGFISVPAVVTRRGRRRSSPTRRNRRNLISG